MPPTPSPASETAAATNNDRLDDPPSYQPPESASTSPTHKVSSNSCFLERAKILAELQISFYTERALPTRISAYARHPRGALQTYPSKPIVVQLEQRQPGRVDKPGFIETGDLIRLERDIILLPANIDFDAIVRVLRRRVEQRGLAEPPGAVPNLMTYEGLSLRVNQKFFSPWVQLDKFSWEAARELLLQRDEAVLSFCFMVVPKDYEVAAAAREASAAEAADQRRVAKRSSFIDVKKKRKESCVVQ